MVFLEFRSQKITVIKALRSDSMRPKATAWAEAPSLSFRQMPGAPCRRGKRHKEQKMKGTCVWPLQLTDGPG